MLLAWGTYAYQHPRATAPERCPHCAQDAVERRPLERTSHLLYVPLFPRRFHDLTRCAHCKRVEVERARRGSAPRRVLVGRIALAWALIVGGVLAMVAGGVITGREARAHAASPAVGDRWTIRTRRWPHAPDGLLAYARVRVEGVEAGQVALAACDYTADTDDTIERRCTQYPIDLDPIAAADVPRLLDRGAIVSIWRDGDPMEPYQVAAGLCAIGAILLGLVTWRTIKRSQRDADAMPRATIAIG